jgi:hypothetical protein
MSPTLRWPVSSPWALRWRGSPTAYLSTQQRVLLLYLARTTKRGDRTLEEIGRVLGITSRGQVSRELRRLRHLELIGYRAWRGSRGRHRIWLGRGAARLRRAARERAQHGANDSLSTPFGGFISRQGLEAAARRSGSPLLAGRAAARDGPRRGGDPPRQLYATCPAGHSTRLGRRSWTRAPGVGTLRAVWTGICRRCDGRPVQETLELEVRPPEPRPPSPAELADPGLLEQRRRLAAELVDDPATPWPVRAQLRRDYLA